MNHIGLKEAARNTHQHWGNPSGFYKMPADKPERYLGPDGRAQAERDAKAKAATKTAKPAKPPRSWGEQLMAATEKRAIKKTWPKHIRPVSKRRQKATAEYRAKARAFVAADIAAGKRCPVVAMFPELRNGMKYGHPISDRLNEVHHRRGRVGALLLDERFWLAVSKEGHRFIHANIHAARLAGFICRPGEWNVPPETS